MALLKNIFVEAKTDKDTDNVFIKQGYVRHAENLRTYVNGNHSGAETNIKGNALVADETGNMSSSPKCITSVFDKERDRIYYFIGNSDGSHSKIVAFNKSDSSTVVLVEDATLNLLKFNTNTIITGIGIINNLLFWANPLTNPMYLNIEDAYTTPFTVDTVELEDLSVKVKPPFNKPKIVLSDTITPDEDKENNIEEKFIAYGYRWRYKDGQYSDPSPFSEYAFYPENFRYDFSEQSNPGMVNRYNQVAITINTGDKRVTEVQVLFREAVSDDPFVVDDYVKTEQGWNDNQEVTINFSNNKLYRGASKTILRNYFSNVPVFATNQLILGNRIFYGDYTENFNLQSSGVVAQERINYTLELVSIGNTSVDDEGEVFPTLIPKNTIKTNRDVQVGIVYVGPFGRTSIVLVSKENSIHVPVSKSGNKNQIRVTINHSAFSWATHYRFFVQVNRDSYQTILPSLFYEDAGFRWVKLEGADKNKVKEGDYLTVKSSADGISNRLIKTKVLEVTLQEKNFLQVDDVTDSIVELAGLYFKIKPKGFSMDIGDLQTYEIETFDSSRNEYNNPIRATTAFISDAHFYGTGLDDAVSNTGTGYTGGHDTRFRYVMEIEVGGTTFKWGDDGGDTFPITGVAITGGGTPQVLSRGVSIAFGSASGYTVGDQYTINARGTFTIFGLGNAYGFFRINKKWGESANIDGSDDQIRSGARIHLDYHEYGKGSDDFVIDNISSRDYDDIQEWFFGEGIGDEISAQSNLTYATNINFVKGILFYDDNATQITQHNTEGIVTMTIRSHENGTAASRVKVRAISELIQFKGYFPYCFETEGLKAIPDLYHEVGKTYKISGANHLVDNTVFGDADQAGSSPAVVTLDFWNAFSYGNGVESQRIKDDFNTERLDDGVRTLTTIKEDFKKTRRKASITWSDVFTPDGTFNGLSNFLLSEINFIDLQEEDGAITGLINSQGNLQVIQEDNAMLIPYNKNIIQDVAGNDVIGLSKTVLDVRSVRHYQGGKYGCQNRESIATDGFRTYFIDLDRASFVRLSVDGVTPVTKQNHARWMADTARLNRNTKMFATFNQITDEYLVTLIPATEDVGFVANTPVVAAFYEGSKGIPLFYTFSPEQLLGAEDDYYTWKDGIMYKQEVNTVRNNYFGEQFDSKLIFVSNTVLGMEKVANAIRLQTNKPWDVKITSAVAEANIPKNAFVQKETNFYSHIRGNEKSDSGGEAVFGIGRFPISSGVINAKRGTHMSIGDEIVSEDNPTGFTPTVVISDINTENDTITLSSNINLSQQFLAYKKNSGIEGGAIHGDYFVIEMTNDDTEEVYLKSVAIEVAASLLTE